MNYKGIVFLKEVQQELTIYIGQGFINFNSQVLQVFLCTETSLLLFKKFLYDSL